MNLETSVAATIAGAVRMPSVGYHEVTASKFLKKHITPAANPPDIDSAVTRKTSTLAG
jgi:hypothetical protein